MIDLTKEIGFFHVDTNNYFSCRVLATDLIGSFPIAVAVQEGENEEVLVAMNLDGEYDTGAKIGHGFKFRNLKEAV